jgi:membrane protein implicated in regulation of membrane protease activity
MFVVNDLLDAILLGCFFFGLIFSGLSLFLGIIDIGAGHHGAGHNGHGGYFGHHGHNAGHDAHHGHASGDVLSPISVGTILGFLTWFGGVAYLARNGLATFAAVSLFLGALAGLAGGYVIYWLLRKVHSQQAGLLRAADDYMPGTIARVTSSIRAGGTGEIVYEQRGVRQVSAARNPSGEAIPRGTEVVIVKHGSGIAQVEPWTKFVGDGFDELETGHEGRITDLPPPSSEPQLSSQVSQSEH